MRLAGMQRFPRVDEAHRLHARVQRVLRRQVEVAAHERPHRPGQREEGAVFEVDRAQLPEGLEPQVGQPLGLTDPNGQMIPAFIAEVGDSTITIDANHPLAGQDLNFEIRLVDIDS